MEPTTVITTTQHLVFVPLPSGNVAAVVYSASFGEIVIAVLLVCLLALQVVQLWRSGRARREAS